MGKYFIGMVQPSPCSCVWYPWRYPLPHGLGCGAEPKHYKWERDSHCFPLETHWEHMDIVTGGVKE